MQMRYPAAMAASIGCLFLSTTVTGQEEMKAARVVVEGPEYRVFQFNQSLNEILNAMYELGEGESLAIDCGIGDAMQSCDDLNGNRDGSDPVSVRYVTTRELEYLVAFVRSWAKLQDQGVNPVTMEFDMQIAPPDCSNPSFAIQPCYGAPQCSFTKPKRCDKVPGHPCSSCGVPPP